MTLLTDAQIYELWESDPEGFYASDAFHDAARAVEAAVIAALKERESAPAPNHLWLASNSGNFYQTFSRRQA
ncbi:hypothetical protein [Rhodoferax antarcticus]|uniref:hypothetical protein n=1 Tax=Rhodoferax antarcticus TaxID=81479 RepID=UPI00094F8F4F|nr:hypothetical protein [Rhodoferax antarcticus]